MSARATQTPDSAARGTDRAGAWPELGLAALVLAIGAVVLVDTARMDVPAVDNVVGPQFFPFLVGGLLVATGAWLAVDVLRGGRGEPDVDEDVDPSAPSNWRTVGWITGAFVAHVLLVGPAGWLVAGAVLFGGVAVALGARPRVAAPVAVVLAALVFVVFDYALGVPLPTGVLEGVV